MNGETSTDKHRYEIGGLPVTYQAGTVQDSISVVWFEPRLETLVWKERKASHE